MTSSSDTPRRSRLHDPVSGPQTPNAEASRNAAYARFIPREELNGFSAWKLGSFGDDPDRKPQAAPSPEALRRAEEEARQRAEREAVEAVQREARQRQEAVQSARDGGYQDGYRDGLAALEAFKQSHASQTSAQVTAVVQTLHARLEALEKDLARRVAGIALDVARQVVRDELQQSPEHIVAVTQEALSVLLVSARHVTVRLNADDLALVTSACAETLAARGARLVADPEIERGGCEVESDIGSVDATVATRWRQATDAMGLHRDWPETESSGDAA